ncbi:MAG: quinone oxidoreductase [Pelagibacteraceae bacterium]|jgi:NADPH2:quinone reductase|nr:quinone oxidoreductase [Candidatus Pelagibacter sp.]MDP6680816.1 quinone oxidoreductase [Pelagibacteraceae bacterium]MDP6710621.1 quinone oxidoreductase [Pelagibacteraceae bacterium]|tara:strand:- start:207 stop:1181 length:975 start_codon:yes stop_codon:yes gene_type:complete
MTRVVKIEKTGGPEVLKFETIKLGEPNPDEVLIEHKAIGLNFIDTYHRSGLYPLELPSEIGGEGSGVIKKIGSKVKDFSIGDRVAYAGVPLGAYSSERNYPIKNLVKIPNDISFDIAATLMTKGLTSYYLLYKTYPVSANETILFHAAAGGVGQIFCQWAKSLGCKIIGTVGSVEKINIAKKNGCDFVINYSKENFPKRVLEITKGKGVPVVFDGVGKNTFGDSIECLKTRGMMVSFGNSSGPVANIDVKKMIQPKGLYFTRPVMSQYLGTKDEIKEGAEKLFEKIQTGKVKIGIFKKYKLEDAIQAHKDLEARKIIGPAIITP